MEENSVNINEQQLDTEVQEPAQQVQGISEEELARLVEERAKEIATKHIVKEKNKLKSERDLLSQQRAELESEKLAKMNENEKTAYQIQELSKQLAEMQKATQEKEQAFEYEKMANQTKDILVEKGLPIGLTSMVMAGTNNDAEAIMKNIQALNDLMQEAVTKQVQERIKASSHVPKAAHSAGNGQISLEDISKMSPDEINARWDEIMKQGKLK